jgi:acyl carrier protein
VHLDIRSLRAQIDSGPVPALLRSLIRAPMRRAANTGYLARALAASPTAEHEGVVVQFVRGEVAAVLGHASAQAVDTGRAFNELGFDSLAALELRNRLNAATGVNLPATLVFDYPTPAAVAKYVLSRVAQVIATKPSIDDWIGNLEEALAAIDGNDSEQARIRLRLQDLSRRLEAFLADDFLTRASGRADEEDQLEAASDAELLAFIDRRRGDASDHESEITTQ